MRRWCKGRGTLRSWRSWREAVCGRSSPPWRQALAGHFRLHHAFLTTQILAHLDHLEETITTLSDRITAVLAPFADAVQRLDTIPGVNQRTAEVLIAEIGVDMSRFPERPPFGQLGQSLPRESRECWQATRTKNSAVAARYRRILRHRGHKKAIVAVAHHLLITTYHVLASHTTYQELGADYYDHHHTERVTRRAVQTLEQQGYRVTLERAA